MSTLSSTSSIDAIDKWESLINEAQNVNSRENSIADNATRPTANENFESSPSTQIIANGETPPVPVTESLMQEGRVGLKPGPQKRSHSNKGKESAPAKKARLGQVSQGTSPEAVIYPTLPKIRQALLALDKTQLSALLKSVGLKFGTGSTNKEEMRERLLTIPQPAKGYTTNAMGSMYFALTGNVLGNVSISKCITAMRRILPNFDGIQREAMDGERYLTSHIDT